MSDFQKMLLIEECTLNASHIETKPYQHGENILSKKKKKKKNFVNICRLS